MKGAVHGAPLPPPSVVYNAAEQLAVSDLPQAPGQYLHMARHEWGQPQDMSDPNRTHGLHFLGAEGFWEEWVPADRSGVWQLSRDVDTGTVNGPLAGERPLPTLVSGISMQEGTFRAPKGDYFPTPASTVNSYDTFFADLPLDPKELYRRLADESARGQDPAAEMVERVGWMLSRPIPIAVRKALYQALSYHPWLRVDENARTRDGRSAVALSVPNQYTTRSIQLLVDPVNGLLLGMRQVRLIADSPDAPAGTVFSETELHWSVVNGLGEK